MNLSSKNSPVEVTFYFRQTAWLLLLIVYFCFYTPSLSASLCPSTNYQSGRKKVPTAGQSIDTSNPRIRFTDLCKQFSIKCNELRKSAETNGSKNLANRCTEHLFVNEINDNILLLPGFGPSHQIPKTEAERVILEKLSKIETDFSDQLTELAKEIAIQGTERISNNQSIGFHWDAKLARHLIWLSLFWNPENKKVRYFVGFKKSGDGWVSGKYRVPKPRKSRRRHRQLGWAARSYWTVDSGNFLILCRSKPEQAQSLITNLESWRLLWRQCMMPFWVKENIFRSRLMDLRPLPTSSETKHTIVLFQNRQNFLQQLAHISGIEQSVGYYDPKLKKSFFYLGDESERNGLEATWKHETVHQLFQETGRHSLRPGEKNNMWLSEGIAMYFESLRSATNWTPNERSVWFIGGQFAPRLQHSRIRVYRENYFVELKQFWSRGRVAFQRSNDIVRDYSQAAGFTQFLLEYRNGIYRESVFQMLDYLYAGRSRSDMVWTITKQSDKALTIQYQNWLKSSEEAIQNEHQTGMTLGSEVISLSNSKLTGNSLVSVPTRNVRRFCLSSNQIESIPISWLRKLDRLEDFYLDINPITDKLIIAISVHCKSLVQLDIASTLVTDDGITNLPKCQNLEYLWAAGTQISDHSIPSILKIPKLKYLDVRKTKISRSGAEQLRKRIQKVLF